MVASRVLQGVTRKGQLIAAAIPKVKQQSLHRKITTQATTANASRQIPQNPPTADVSSGKSAYATVAPGHHSALASFHPSSKFRVPFDEGPGMTGTLDNIVEQVDSIPEDVEKERGYQIIGKVKAGKDDILKILAVGDMRIWQ